MHSKQMADFSYIPFPNPDVILQEEGDGKAVLVNLDTGNAVSLNAVGRFIWNAVDGNISVEEIINKIKQNFFAVPNDIGDDVIKLVNILKLNGFFGCEIKDNQL